MPPEASGPPAPPRRPHPLTAHGHTRTDDWYWLRDASDPEVLAHLEAENAYADAVLAPLAGLQEELFQRIKSRVQETDAGPPARSGPWWYYSRTFEGRQYGAMCRRLDPERRLDAARVAADARAGTPDDEVIVLDENALAEGRDFLTVGIFDISPDHRLLAYGVDYDGSEEYTLRFRDLDTGSELPDVVERAYYGSAWAGNGTFFYVRPDDSMRPWQVWCHRLGDDPAEDRLVFQEDDERFFVDLSLARTERRIVIHTASKTTSEVWWIDTGSLLDGSAGLQPQLLLGRRPGIEVDAEHDGDSWLIRSNEPGPEGADASNFWVYRLGPDGGGPSQPVLEPRPDVKVEAVDAFAGFTVFVERSAHDGLESLRILRRDGHQEVINQPEPVYCLLGGQNPDWDQPTYRFGYTSMVTPRTSVDYHVATRRRTPVWSQLVAGYDPAGFRTERLWADAPDGTRVPVSILRRADRRPDGRAPGLLYGYGAYESSTDPTFSVPALNLVERGAVLAIAHIRGGGELGRSWYEQGRMEHKVNTFTDFIAAAEALVADGWVAPDRLVARGGSAGGLLIGAVLNMAPHLWRALVAEVPFVDVVTTMSDTSLPLTVTEWEEWGDPVHDQNAYRRMLSYSPYDNVEAREEWPAIYVTAGLHDPRVGFWEPAKWVVKLRAAGAGRDPERPVILKIEMGAGHQGPSGRYDSWRDQARTQAFVLSQMGLA